MEIWRQPKGRMTRQRKVRERDGELCRVPMCSRAADDVHHIIFRSRGGTHALENQVSVCAAHHRAIHNGWIRVWNDAPDRLTWQLGVRPGLPPLIEYAATGDGASVPGSPLSVVPLDPPRVPDPSQVPSRHRHVVRRARR
jgi:HNH endonuclease